MRIRLVSPENGGFIQRWLARRVEGKHADQRGGGWDHDGKKRGQWGKGTENNGWGAEYFAELWPGNEKMVLFLVIPLVIRAAVWTCESWRFGRTRLWLIDSISCSIRHWTLSHYPLKQISISFTFYCSSGKIPRNIRPHGYLLTLSISYNIHIIGRGRLSPFHYFPNAIMNPMPQFSYNTSFHPFLKPGNPHRSTGACRWFWSLDWAVHVKHVTHLQAT